MIKKRKVLFISFAVIIGIAVIAISGVMVGGPLVYDAKLPAALNLAEKRIPGLSISYQETSSGLFSREGVVHWSFALKKGNVFNLDELSGKALLKVVFAPLGIKGEFYGQKGGTFERLLEQNSVLGFSYQGAFNVKPFPPQVDFAVKTDNMAIGLENGKCSLGQASIYAIASSFDKVDLELNAAGFDCKSNLRYSGQSAYAVRLEGLNVKAEPSYIDKKVGLRFLSIGLADFYADFSTLYAIGFAPDDHVRDPSLREYIGVKNVGATLEIKAADEKGFSEVASNGSGDLEFAFPYVEYGTRNELSEFKDFRYNFALGKVNLKELAKVLTVPDTAVLATLFKAVDDKVSLKLNDLSSSYKNDGFVIKGTAGALIDKERLRLKDLSADFDVKSGKDFTDFLVSKEQSELISSSLAEGKIFFEDPYYITKFKLEKGNVTLNGVPFKADENED